MPRRKVWVMLLDIAAGFAEDFQVADDSVLYHFVPQERELVYIFGIAVDPLDRLQHVRQIVDQALQVLAHTSTACASTAVRKLSGSAFGVSTSTGTPSSCKSSCRIAPMSTRSPVQRVIACRPLLVPEALDRAVLIATAPQISEFELFGIELDSTHAITPTQVRTIIYTTNAIESLYMHLRKIVKNR